MKIIIVILFSPLFLFAQFTDDFSDGNITSNPTWLGDVLNFEVDSNYLLHLNDSIANTSYLVTQSNVVEGEWVFSIRLDFEPSTNNFAKVYLISDKEDLLDPLNGMYVRIGGQSGVVDDVSLYAQNGTNSTEIIDGFDGVVAENPDIMVKVTRDAIGNWELFVDTSGILVSQGVGFDNTIVESNYFGVYCKYTITRSKKFWFDNFNVTGVIPSSTCEMLNLNKNTEYKALDILGRSVKNTQQNLIFRLNNDGSVEKRCVLD